MITVLIIAGAIAVFCAARSMRRAFRLIDKRVLDLVLDSPEGTASQPHVSLAV